MVIDTNSVTNLPGLDDRKMDRLIALRAACQVTGAPADRHAVKYFVHEFARWLKESHSDADKLMRRYVLLTVTEGRSALGTSERDAGTVAKLVDDLYREAN